MAYLSLLEQVSSDDVVLTTGVGRGAYGQDLSQVAVRLPPAVRERLQTKMTEAIVDGQELRVDLTASWTLFCRAAPGPARLLLAKPDVGAWVATLSLEAVDWPSFWSLTAGTLRQALLARGRPLHPSSNLDFLIQT